jgi:hypothetical protein
VSVSYRANAINTQRRSMNQFPDELDDLPTVPAKVSDPASPAAATTAAAPANANVQSWDADDSDDVSKSILKSGGANYIKVQENQPARIAFIPGAKILGAPVHYSEGQNKYFLCDSKTGKRGACCEKLGDAKGRAAAYVFHYLNADPQSGKMAPGVAPQVEVGIFTMSKSNWDDVKNGIEEGAKVVDVDYRISVSEKQLTRKVAVIASKARWYEIKDAALALAAPYLANPQQLTRALGRKYESATSLDAQLADIEVM